MLIPPGARPDDVLSLARQIENGVFGPPQKAWLDRTFGGASLLDSAVRAGSIGTAMVWHGDVCRKLRLDLPFAEVLRRVTEADPLPADRDLSRLCVAATLRGVGEAIVASLKAEAAAPRGP